MKKVLLHENYKYLISKIKCDSPIYSKTMSKIINNFLDYGNSYGYLKTWTLQGFQIHEYSKMIYFTVNIFVSSIIK